jgi:hypothetical protein
MRNAVAAIALVSCLAAPAHAAETFRFSITGSIVHFVDWWECQCFMDPVTLPWNGWMNLTTASAADGVYTGDELIDLTLSTSRASFSVDGHGVGDSVSYATWISVTLAGGAVAAIDGSVELGNGPFEIVRFESDHLHYIFEGAHHVGPSEGTAIYAAIPEPGTYALLLAGLTLVAGFKPARRSRLAHRSAARAPAG